MPGALAIGAPPPPALPPPPPPALPPPQPAPRAHQSAAVQHQQRMDYPEEDAYPESKGRVCMIHKGAPSKRSQKLVSKQVNMAETSPPATPEFLNWSDASITFSRADHPPKVPYPGHAALVLEAQIGGYNLSRVFMDGGSGINIIYVDTLKQMNIPTYNLK